MTDNENPMNSYILGESAGTIELNTINDHRDVVCAMAAQARRHIQIFSWHLDPGIYDDPLFLKCIQNFITRNRQASVQIVLQDNTYIVKNGHRLVELMRRLTSKIEIRKPGADYIGHPENMMIVDHVGYVHRELSSRYEGKADFYSPLTVKRYMELFNRAWESGEPDNELRRLSI